MTYEELAELIATAQQFQSELGDIEIKTAQRGTPQRLHESLSAFANRSGGGVILLGVDFRRASNLLRKLQDEGFLKRTGQGRWSRYDLIHSINNL